mgnify:CR=1 FL=1
MTAQTSSNITWHSTKVTKEMREKRNGHRGAVIWLTGLSGAGKSTLAINLEEELFSLGYHTYTLDGDNVRHGLNGDLGFTPEDREENIRRVGEIAKLFADSGSIVITAFISPYRKDRQRVRAILNDGDFVEVYVKCDLEVCEERDPKGLYKKARSGEIPNFTGISAPYEEPENAEITVDTAELSVMKAIEYLVERLDDEGIIDTSKEHAMSLKRGGNNGEQEKIASQE